MEFNELMLCSRLGLGQPFLYVFLLQLVSSYRRVDKLKACYGQYENKNASVSRPLIHTCTFRRLLAERVMSKKNHQNINNKN
jgi:hypothetical protein